MKEVRNIKLKEWIRNKIVQFIMLDKIEEHLLQEINRLEKASEKKFRLIDNGCENLHSSILKLDKEIKSNKEDIDDILHNTIKNVVSVGADVVPNVMSGERSWAVVCIEGNYNVVKFIDMHGADYRYILDFLKQFKGSRMVVDAPKFAYFEDAFKM